VAAKGLEFADNQAAQDCLLAGMLCNDSALEQKAGRWEVHGDPTEGALLTSAAKAGLASDDDIVRLKRLDVIPFESQHQYMATLHDGGGDARPKLLVKGAVEVVLGKSTDRMLPDGSPGPLDTAELLQQVNRMAAKGLRVLAFASAKLPHGTASVNHVDVKELTFLGLQGMLDPPRPEAIRAVQACQAAGIQVKMITGDHAMTAQAIAGQLGLRGPDEDDGAGPTVLTGSELSQQSDGELAETVERVAVFARVSPEQKLRLVRALQSRGYVAAMTGDGVNDAPALKQADIGVAMGIAGTEVAKEAADMVLTDDNFATIAAAVEEGRGVFDNLTKFFVWVLPVNMGEGLVILAAVLSGTTFPIYPVQILWINMCTSVLLGLMLAFEPKEQDLMERPPRDPDTPILTGTLILRMLMVAFIMLMGAFGSFNWALGQGYSEDVARTVAVNVFVIVEMFYLFTCRSLTKSMFSLGLFSNRWMILGVTLMLVLQMAFTYTPLMNFFFHSEPIGWDAWWRILLTAVAVYVIVEVEKWGRRRWSRQRPNGGTGTRRRRSQQPFSQTQGANS
jgi:Ca2+-transporting ATPase